MKKTNILVIFVIACGAAVLSYISYRYLAHETVWVVKDKYDGKLHCDIPTSAAAGEWLTLDANRTTGAWERVPKASVREGQLSSPKKPTEYTEHVAPHLQWQTEPPTAEIKQPSLATADFDMKYRQIRFSEPGEYQIRAISHWPYEYTTDWMPISIIPKNERP